MLQDYPFTIDRPRLSEEGEPASLSCSQSPVSGAGIPSESCIWEAPGGIILVSHMDTEEVTDEDGDQVAGKQTTNNHGPNLTCPTVLDYDQQNIVCVYDFDAAA